MQLLDGAAHRHRKVMLKPLMTPERLRDLQGAFAAEWSARLPAWEQREKIILFEELREMLFVAACVWAGIPLAAEDVRSRTHQFAEMIEATGSFGPRAWRALWLRRRAERWVRDLITAIRERRHESAPSSAAAIIARHRDEHGHLLEVATAAVELINVVRPIVAVSRFIVFAALALHQHPEWRARLAGAPDDLIEAFVQEVRRVSPFFPFIGGRVREPFAWSGRSFAQGEWVLLDLYGTSRDPRAFDSPDEFRPERFIGRAPDPFAFVPQGGGDVWSNHRCPGERLTIDLMKTAVTLLTENMEYDVPVQQLSVDLSQIPALPQSGFVMSHVRRHHAVPRGDNGSWARGRDG